MPFITIFLRFSLLCGFIFQFQTLSAQQPDRSRYQLPWHLQKFAIKKEMNKLPNKTDKILFLRDFVYSMSLWGGHTNNLPLPVADKDTWKLSLPEMYAIVANDSMFVECGFLADFFAKLCNFYGFQASTCNFGKEDSKYSHVAALVQITRGDSTFYTFHDPSFGYTYVDTAGAWLSLDQIVGYLKAEKFDQLIRLETPDSLYARIYLSDLYADILEGKERENGKDDYFRISPTRNPKLPEYLLYRNSCDHRFNRGLMGHFAAEAHKAGFARNAKALLLVNLRLYLNPNYKLLGKTSRKIVKNIPKGK